MYREVKYALEYAEWRAGVEGLPMALVACGELIRVIPLSVAECADTAILEIVRPC